jgi:hypothetical protein
MHEAYRALYMHISLDLLFHVSFCKTPNEIWTTMEGLFGKQDGMRGHMLKVELLVPRRSQKIILQKVIIIH